MHSAGMHAPGAARGPVVSYKLRGQVEQGPDGFIHHPSGFPLRFRRIWFDALRHRSGHGRASLGLAFETSRFVRPGTWIEVSIPLRGVVQRFRGEVVLVRAIDQGYEVGLWLESDDDAARARIVEQICHIECYLRCKGGDRGGITRESAAREWVSRFAAGFPVF